MKYELDSVDIDVLLSIPLELSPTLSFLLAPSTYLEKIYLDFYNTL